MPVQLPTTFGKAEYEVVDALRRLATAVNTLESRSTTAPTGLATVAEVSALRRQIVVLQQQVQGLLNP